MDTGTGWHTVVVLALAALAMVSAAALVAMGAEWACRTLEAARRRRGRRAHAPGPHPEAEGGG